MPRNVVISTCLECPYCFHRKGERKPFCNSISSHINVDPNVEVDPRCPLEEVNYHANSQEDHRSALKFMYQILQKKGINEDSLHEANAYFNQYLKSLPKKEE